MPLPIHDSHRFTWAPETRSLVAEHSDFNDTILCDRIAGADAFIIRSHRSGRHVTFILEDIERDAEREITGWRFRPINKAAADVEGVSVLIIND
jgi:hypothetical protein